MSPRPDVSEERKNQILDAAQAVFARLGFHDARMDDIVEEAGLSKGALYWYFKSKDAIIGAILRRLFDRELRGLRSLLTMEGPIADRLIAYTRRAGAEILRTPGLSAIALEFYAVAARHKTVHAWLDDYYQRYRELLAGLIREGIARGEFRAVNPDAAAVTLIALYEGLGLLWLVSPRSFPWDEHALSGLRILLDGMRAEAGAAPAIAPPG